MKKQVLASIIAGFAILTLFQNCGPNPIAFNSNEIGLTKVSVADGASSSSEVDQPAPMDNSAGAGPAAAAGDSDKKDDSSASETEVAEVAKDSDESDDSEDSADDSQSGALNYICILAGPGKSVAVGFNDGALEGQNSTPQVVCMSESACTNLISKKFSVKGPEQRGYCPNKNKHVVPMTDAQIADLLK